MIIKKIRVSNFKSFNDVTIEFGKINVLVGANASGKSNTVGIFRFIDQVIDFGLESAVSLSGGLDYLLNASIGRTKPMQLEFSIACAENRWVLIVDKKRSINLLLTGFDYSFEITPHKRGGGYNITKDVLVMKYCQTDMPESKSESEGAVYCDEKTYAIEYKKLSGKLSYKVLENKTDYADSRELNEGIDSQFLARRINVSKDKNELIINKIALFMPPVFSNFIRIFDFDPKLMKRSCSLSSIKMLEEDGSNIASVLQPILKSTMKRKRLTDLVSDCLPFVQQIDTENNFDKSITYKFKEKYTSKTFYANFLSDGSASILAIVIALYFERNIGIVILEEPERNLHPGLMGKIMMMAKESSKSKQVIITTHTPEMIRCADIDSILLAKRCEKGFTHIEKPSESPVVQEFIKNEIGLGDLFLQNLLGD